MWLQDHTSAALQHCRVVDVLRSEEETRLVLDLFGGLGAVDGIHDDICSRSDDDDYGGNDDEGDVNDD